MPDADLFADPDPDPGATRTVVVPWADRFACANEITGRGSSPLPWPHPDRPGWHAVEVRVVPHPGSGGDALITVRHAPDPDHPGMGRHAPS